MLQNQMPVERFRILTSQPAIVEPDNMGDAHHIDCRRCQVLSQRRSWLSSMSQPRPLRHSGCLGTVACHGFSSGAEEKCTINMFCQVPGSKHPDQIYRLKIQSRYCEPRLRVRVETFRKKSTIVRYGYQFGRPSRIRDVWISTRARAPEYPNS